MSVRVGDLCPISELQPTIRMASGHSLQSPSRVQSQDLQQSRIRCPIGSICPGGFRGCLPADADVHYPIELRQRLGFRVSKANCDVDSVLDRVPSQRTSPVARQSPQPNEPFEHPMLIRLLINTLPHSLHLLLSRLSRLNNQPNDSNRPNNTNCSTKIPSDSHTQLSPLITSFCCSTINFSNLVQNANIFRIHRFDRLVS